MGDGRLFVENVRGGGSSRPAGFETAYMGLFDWLWGNGRGEDPRLGPWRSRWRQAADAGDTGQREALARDLEALGLTDDEIEIEREMLEALDRLGAMRAEVEATGLPILETGHRVVG